MSEESVTPWLLDDADLKTWMYDHLEPYLQYLAAHPEEAKRVLASVWVVGKED